MTTENAIQELLTRWGEWEGREDAERDLRALANCARLEGARELARRFEQADGTATGEFCAMRLSLLLCQMLHEASARFDEREEQP